MAVTVSRRSVAVAVVLALALALIASVAWSAPVPSQTTCAASATGQPGAVTAERDLIKGKLMDFGLSEKEAASRVALLADEEVHAIAADLDSLRTAGVTAGEKWDTVTVLLLVILVVLIVD